MTDKRFRKEVYKYVNENFHTRRLFFSEIDYLARVCARVWPIVDKKIKDRKAAERLLDLISGEK